MAELLKVHRHSNASAQTTIVFIHGWGLNSAIFDPVSKRLAQHFQVIGVDLPGFGLNHQNTCHDYALDTITDRVAKTLQAELSGKAVLVGWSLGGLVATQLTLRYPHLVAGLVSLCSTPKFRAGDSWPGIESRLLTSFHAALADDAGKTINNFLKLQAMGSEHVRQDIKTIRALIHEYPSASIETLDHSLNLLEQVDLRAKLVNISVPVLRMYGRLDALVPKLVIPQVDKLWPDTDTYTFERASHAPFISHSDEFYTVLMDWITGKISADNNKNTSTVN
ncbi:pimeloyl-ACP methyl ester esterase BioH [Thalassotalea litorea]|uniref:Pimeloyl-[acyl-carrier protein] methyl ester esterase n=1 Tax=Thalassotalea litorea TaxID=2020715 RepID=A0A5R9IID8_9GAMM|nr:pimeloyl-ACP methyl ester esterase BioH [Thalassotalea litorea]TLU65310.1 pimeloyl-ACP methyl ester esterase BioH [Thalassotalea litorea]